MAVSLQTVRGGSGPPKGISTEECSHRKLCPRMTSVEKRKISYFGLARNLIRHLISPNQDDLSYLSRTFISG